jgi:hypothetical protein
MGAEEIRKEIENFTSRLLISGLSVMQFVPSVRKYPGNEVRLGSLQLQSVALRDISYDEVYSELDANDSYHVKLMDGGLLIFQYSFLADGTLKQHRLGYFPNPKLPSVDDAPDLYERDELYGDITAKRLVRFPIRFDYAPDQWRDVVHPKSHLSLGQYENCRIPVSGPLGPSSFGMFILRSFYFRAYMRHKNTFDRKPVISRFVPTISKGEKRITHLVQGS